MSRKFLKSRALRQCCGAPSEASDLINTSIIPGDAGQVGRSVASVKLRSTLLRIVRPTSQGFYRRNHTGRAHQVFDPLRQGPGHLKWVNVGGCNKNGSVRQYPCPQRLRTPMNRKLEPRKRIIRVFRYSSLEVMHACIHEVLARGEV